MKKYKLYVEEVNFGNKIVFFEFYIYIGSLGFLYKIFFLYVFFLRNIKIRIVNIWS